MSEESVGHRWAGRVVAGDIQEQKPTRQLFDIDVIHEYERQDIEWADGTTDRDHGHVLLELRGLNKEEEPYRVHLTEDQTLRLAFLLNRTVSWIEDDRSDLPDIQRQAERLNA